MKEYLIVYSYVKRDYYVDNDKDAILSSIPNLGNDTVGADSKKEAIRKFFEYRNNRECYTILNIIDLEEGK